MRKSIDHLLLAAVSLLVLFGLIMIYNSSLPSAFGYFDDKYYFLKQQLISIVIGFLAMLFFLRINYRFLFKISPLILMVSFLLLVVVLIPAIGMNIYGARRWINFGFFNFQPAEFAKFSLVLYFASYCSKNKKLLPFLLILSLFVLLVMLQPDLGTTIVIVFSSLAILFISGVNLLSFFTLILLGIFGFMAMILTSSYRRERLMTFLNNTSLDSSYHIKQAVIALGAGGFWGVGLGASRQKFAYLPEAITDSIFAIIAEEVGFLGTVLLILVLLFVIWRGFKIANEASDFQSELLAVGITSWLGIQTVLNLAGMVALFPLTGVPLPFISFGGTSLVLNLAGIGLLLNISRNNINNQTKKKSWRK